MNAKEISAVGVTCASCKQPNSPEEKFCKGCGHALYEPCEKCLQPVLLGQKFCGGCGTDLEQIVAIRQRKYDEHLAKAVAAAKALDFETSLGLLQVVANVQDFRFQPSTETARKALKQVTELRDRTVSKADQRIARAIAHYEAGDLAEVVRLLKNVSENLLDEKTKKIYLQSANSIEQLRSLEQEFATASRDKDWVLAGELVQQLQTAMPDNRVYQKAAAKIAAKLYAKAESLFAAKKYAAAAKRLAAIPAKSQTPEAEELNHSIRTIQWLESTVQSEPFASPTLGRLAVRLSKSVPNDPGGSNLVQEIAKTLKESARHPRSHMPKWRGDTTAWTGSQFQYFAWPTRIDLSEKNETLRTKPGRFCVAIGLAIQGLGKARVTDQYSGRKKKMNLFGRKKIQPCWGIDVGSHSMKAVRMELTGEELLVTDCFYHEFDQTIAKTGDREHAIDRIETAVNRWKETHDWESKSIWVNLPGSDVTNRFIRLPPVDDKKASGLIDQEIRDRIPVPMDELVITKAVGEFEKECTYGRPLVFSAARKSTVEKRLDLFEKTGLSIDGLQSDSNALVNLIAWEFADQLSLAESDDTEAGQVVSREEKTPTIAWLDAGASTTTLLYVSGETHWFWSIENGGDDLVRALAKSSQKTHREAGTLMAQSEKMDHPALQFAAVELRMGELCSRLAKVAEDALKQNSRFQVKETYVSGGAALTTGWMRRVVGRSSS